MMVRWPLFPGDKRTSQLVRYSQHSLELMVRITLMISCISRVGGTVAAAGAHESNDDFFFQCVKWVNIVLCFPTQVAFIAVFPFISLRGSTFGNSYGFISCNRSSRGQTVGLLGISAGPPTIQTQYVYSGYLRHLNKCVHLMGCYVKWAVSL